MFVSGRRGADILPSFKTCRTRTLMPAAVRPATPPELDRTALDSSCWEGRCVASAMTETERRRVSVAIETEHRAEIADIEPALK
jgi:hypothetical protein